MKTIGILGGLGPKTTSELYLEIVNDKTLVDYPNILISNVSFPKGLDSDIIRNKKDTSLMLEPLLFSIDQLKRAGVENIILPCNTLEDLSSRLNDKFKISLITPATETCRKIKELNIKKIGLIATSKTRNLQIYEKKLPDVEIIYPSLKSQEEVSLIINRIISNESRREDRDFINILIGEMKEKGCEKVILGCTDLSVLVKKGDAILDSFRVLKDSILSRAYLKDNF